MNKYISLFGSLVMVFLFAYTINITINNPTALNIIISLGFLIFSYIGFSKFFKQGKLQTKEEEFTPVKD